ncbi:hypothetical protein PMAYCL1PPCAC_04395, partial [Pristionchus mayeri]
KYIYFIHHSFSAQTASLVGFSGFAFAHELYHHVQFANREFAMMDDISDHIRAENCVMRHTDRVCSRFTEKTCSSGRKSEDEDTADIYGSQIAFSVLQRMLGNDMDKIVYPDLN